MKIRTRITLLFFLLVIFIVTAISASIYYFSSNYREDDFYRRLKNRAINTARVLLEVKQIDAALLRQMEHANPASLPDQFVRIYNSGNEELYSSDEANEFSFTESEIQAARAAGEIRMSIRHFEIVGFTFNGSAGEYVIFAGATDLYGNNALQNLRQIIIITFCFSVLMVSVIGYVYAGRVLQPISRIVSEVESITEKSLDKRLDEGNQKDEVARLAQTFNRMLSRLQSAFSAQQNFIANASHELKTPFTVMAGEIEVTLLHPREKDYYIRILRSVLEGIRRFNKLSTQLLLLAQTSSENPRRKFDLLRIDDIVWDAKKELEKYHQDYAIEIDFDSDINHDQLQVSGDPHLLQVLIMNLMDNGCKYSDEPKVRIEISKASRSIVMRFINYGEGIAPEEMENIFAPFFRGKQATKRKGFGVGLSLAERIVKMHNGLIKVRSSDGVTEFAVTLPVSVE